MNQTHKIALITGATAGIGKSTALLFAQKGWDVIITGRRKDRLEALQKQIEADYATKVLILNFDIQSWEESKASIESLSADWQKIDVLVNNAGLAMGRDDFHEADVKDWDTMINTNVKGLLYISRLVSPLMIERQKGHIINVSSIAGKQVYARGNVYCATKHAVDALSKAMRIDLLEYNIRVTSINPGAVETEFSIVRYKGDLEQAAKVYEGYQPLLAEDVADTIVYAATRPPHVNLNEIMLTCTTQANAFYNIKNKK